MYLANDDGSQSKSLTTSVPTLSSDFVPSYTEKSIALGVVVKHLSYHLRPLAEADNTNTLEPLDTTSWLGDARQSVDHTTPAAEIVV